MCQAQYRCFPNSLRNRIIILITASNTIGIVTTKYTVISERKDVITETRKMTNHAILSDLSKRFNFEFISNKNGKGESFHTKFQIRFLQQLF